VRHPLLTVAALAAALLASTALAQSQTPWRTNATGTFNINGAKNWNEGYAFTPNASGTVTQLCGNYKGSGTVRLYNRSTGAQLAAVAVTASNAWACASITPVAVAAGTTYTVTSDMATNTSETWRSSLSPPLPQTYGNIRIEESCEDSVGARDPCIVGGGVLDTMWGQADITFVPDAPTKLAFVSAPQSMVVSTCSAIATVETQQASGGAAGVTAATTVNLSSTSGTTTFYASTDATCATPLTSVAMAAGATQARFRFKDSAAGSPTLTAAATGLTSTTQGATFAGSRLAFISAAQTLTQGACSAQVTVQNQTGAGAAQNVTVATALALSSSSTNYTFYSDAACTSAISGVTIAASE
jgi:hypothetical protein